MNTSNGDFKKHVLISVMGLSPAIITETVWRLCVKEKRRLDEVQVLTTQDGKEGIVKALFDTTVWMEFLTDYGLHNVSFKPDFIEVLTDGQGTPLRDIRTLEDNDAAANIIVDFVRKQTKDVSSSKLYCSVAGGRKAMGVHLSYALQLFGRPQDELFQILVHPSSLESCREFYYPPPADKPKTFEIKNRDGTTEKVASQDIQIDVAGIPFVRLRHIIDAPPWKNLSYSEVVKRTQARVDQEQIRVLLNLNERRVAFQINEKDIAVLRLGKKASAQTPLPRSDDHLSALGAAYYCACLLNTTGQSGHLETLYQQFAGQGNRRQEASEKVSWSVKSQMNKKIARVMAKCGYPELIPFVEVRQGVDLISLSPDSIEIIGTVPERNTA